ncbi:MAG: ion channel-forming bestrophin family protein [Acidobacteriaceae bacterium]|jgi:putative membrane protein|nr:ion channel-forming bestrophin family protein [Acidobacteriaceae bacterium]
MIIRPKVNWWSMLFVWRGSIVRKILPQLSIVAGLSVFAVWTAGHMFRHKVPLNSTPFTLTGVSLALFLGFRNSSAYDRWWEGRRLWGSLLNTARSLTREALTMTDGSAATERTREFVHLVIAFAYATRDQLRGKPFQHGAELLSVPLAAEVNQARYKPALLLRAMGEWVSQRQREGLFGEVTASTFDRNLNELSNVLGGCERIASTPVPFSYSVMIHRVVYFYCALLPFGLVDAIAWMTPVVSLVIAYSFIALDVLASELEMPFDLEENDLPLDTICRTIELSLREMTGEAVEQQPMEPVQYVLH